MPTTLIFGGSGKVARHLTRLLLLEHHTVHSIIRNPAQSAALAALGAHPIVQSIEDASVADLAATIRRAAPDVVVWSAGAGAGSPARTRAVDHAGAVKSMDACKAAGVARFIIVSAIDLRDRAKGYPGWYDDASKERSDMTWKAIGGYMEAKLAADRDLREGNAERGLQYTIVKPGGLNMEESKGTVAAGRVGLTTTVSREDVAKVVIECMKQPKTIGLAFDVVGGDTPIAEAVQKVAEERIDTFEGMY